MLRLTEVASQSETFVKPALRKAKTKTSREVIGPQWAKRSKSFLLTGRLYWLLDECIARLETDHDAEPYARVCALTLIKARNLLLGSYSLAIDGLAQEAGALLRPFIEAFEKMVYFNEDPSRIEEAIVGRLPSAGEIAKRIQGQFKPLREHLNQHSSHFGLTYESAKHLIDWNTFKFKRVQPYSAEVLRTNLKTIFTFLIFLNVQAVECLFNLKDTFVSEIATQCDACKSKGFDLFDRPTT